MGNVEGSVPVVLDGRRHTVGGIAIRNTIRGGPVAVLADRVVVNAGAGVLDAAQSHLAGGVIRARSDNAPILDKLKGELVRVEGAPGQGLVDLDLIGDARSGGRDAVGVREGEGGTGELVAVRVDASDGELAEAIIRNPDVHDTRGLCVVRDTRGSAALGNDVAVGVGTLANRLGSSLAVVRGRGGGVGDDTHQPARPTPGGGGDAISLNVVVGEDLRCRLGSGLGFRSGSILRRSALRRRGSGFLSCRRSSVGLGIDNGVPGLSHRRLVELRVRRG